ncbi:MAG: response regulator transcription factor [Elusimicrobia bacterium]|nr:response regulator transcription factor [Candidatus Obscuribacterium magneticum]
MASEIKKKVMVVDDDPDIRRLVETILERDGYMVDSASCGAELLRKMPQFKPDLLVLDLQLPDEDGFGILKKLKTNPATAGLPVVMLTVQSVDSYKIAGLEIGADDYIVKPFNHGELIARIKAVLRRSKPKEDAGGIIEDEGVHLFLDQHRLEIDNKPIDLSPKEFDLLAALMRAKNNVLTREVLCESVWGHELYGNTRTVDVHIGRLRKKLGKYENRIETVERIGYRYLPGKT